MTSAQQQQEELKQKGNAQFQLDNEEKAIEFYTQAINLDPAGDATVPILSNRSLCYYNLKKYKEAYEDAGCCCGIRPDWAKGFARRGFAAVKMEEYEIALESFDEYLRLNNNNDEMDVDKSRSAVKKILDDKAKHHKRYMKEVSDAEESLNKISDADERQAKAHKLLVDTVFSGFKPELLQVAIKNGARLDTCYYRKGPKPDYKEFLKKQKDESRHAALVLGHSERHSLTSIAATLLNPFRDPNNRLSRIQLAKYSDIVFDFAEQEEGYEPSPNFQNVMSIMLFYRSPESGNVGPNKDAVMNLLNRGKTFFYGSKKVEHFETEVLAALLRNQFVRLENERRVWSSSSSKEITFEEFGRDLYECVQTCLHAGAKVSNNNSNPDDQEARGFSSNAPMLTNAIQISGSPRLIELLIRHGADVNMISPRDPFDETDSLANPPNPDAADQVMMMSPLQAAFECCNVECVRILMDHKAILPEIPTEDWLLQPESNLRGRLPSFWKTDAIDEILDLIKPKSNYLITDMFTNKQRRNLTEELVRLLFEQFDRQQLSFVFLPRYTGVSCLHTPLSAAINAKRPFPIIELMYKLKAPIVQLPLFAPEGESLDINVLDFLLSLMYDMLNIKDSDMPYFKKVAYFVIFHGTPFVTESKTYTPETLPAGIDQVSRRRFVELYNAHKEYTIRFLTSLRRQTGVPFPGEDEK